MHPLTRQNAFRNLNPSHLTIAAEGGDFQTIFANKFMIFKPNQVVQALKQAKALVGEIPDFNLPAIPLPNFSFPNFDFDINIDIGLNMDAIRELMNKIQEKIRSFRAAAEGALAAIKEAFMKLIEWFAALREALIHAFRELMALLPEFPDISAFFGFLFKFVPELLIDFIDGLLDAILPFIGQIKACGKMLASWAKTTKAAVTRYRLGKAAVALNPQNRFSAAARAAVVDGLTQDFIDRGAESALATGNAAVSVTGLVFTGNIGSIVGGIIMSVAKLALHIAWAVRDYKDCARANKLLLELRGKPREALNPAELFNAAPILAAHYIVQASTHALVANTEIADVQASDRSAWQIRMEALARQMSPLKAHAVKSTTASRLVLARLPTPPSIEELFSTRQIVA